MLTNHQIDNYNKNGFIIPDYKLDESIINSIKADFNRLLKKYPKFNDYCPALPPYDLGFLNYARNNIILDMIEQLIGSNFALWNLSLFAKPPKIGSKTPWHQDGNYWPIHPLSTCSVWIALDDSTIENGCLKFVAGSHKEKKIQSHKLNNSKGLSLPRELEKKFIDEKKIVNVTLESGQMSFHDVFIMHSSELNKSNKPRRALTMRFMPLSSFYDHNSEKFSLENNSRRTLFMMRGYDISGKNDFCVK